MRTSRLCAPTWLYVVLASLLKASTFGCSSNSNANGSQKVTCPFAQTRCDASTNADAGTSYCADLQTDPVNCGKCGTTCVDGAVCSAGQCTHAGPTSCQSNEVLCNASSDAGPTYCADVNADDNNCGCCGNACGPSQSCRAGRCEGTTSFSFFFFGDMHAGVSNYDAVLQVAMKQMTQIDNGAVLAISNGDLVDVPASSNWSVHDSFVAAAGFQLNTMCAASFGAQTRYFGSVGDHDDTGAANWLTLWNQHLPGQQNLGHNGADGIYLSVRYANTFFVMLDTEQISTAQTSWLKETLQGADAQSAQLKFMFFHEPVYSCWSNHPPFGDALPWIDLAEQNQVNVVFGSHTHLYTRSCPKFRGACTADGSGIVYVETGAIGGQPRAVDITTKTVTGTDAEGNPRTDTYDCIVGRDLMQSSGASLNNDFCHVQVNGCVATVNCYVVSDGNHTPFDTWTVNGCGCGNNGADGGSTCGSTGDAG